jgi:hypothetical protein
MCKSFFLPGLKLLLGAELIARTVRKILWAEFRSIPPTPHRHEEATLHTLNTIFGITNSKSFRDNFLCEAIKKVFLYIFSVIFPNFLQRFHISMDPNDFTSKCIYLKNLIGQVLSRYSTISLVLKRIENLAGIEFIFSSDESEKVKKEDQGKINFFFPFLFQVASRSQWPFNTK